MHVVQEVLAVQNFEEVLVTFVTYNDQNVKMGIRKEETKYFPKFVFWRCIYIKFQVLLAIKHFI